MITQTIKPCKVIKGSQFICPGSVSVIGFQEQSRHMSY